MNMLDGFKYNSCHVLKGKKQNFPFFFFCHTHALALALIVEKKKGEKNVSK